MIKNEKQYKISQKKLTDIIQKMTALQQDQQTEKQNELVLISLSDIREDLEKEIGEYDQLKTARISTLKSRHIIDLPSLIIEYKIASGLTQKEFAQKIGMKEQQLQRYEAEGFTSISFKNLLKILQAIDLDVIIQDTPIKKIKTGDKRSIA